MTKSLRLIGYLLLITLMGCSDEMDEREWYE